MCLFFVILLLATSLASIGPHQTNTYKTLKMLVHIVKCRQFCWIPFKSISNVKGKSVPLQAWSDPRGFQEVKIPRFRDNGTG